MQALEMNEGAMTFRKVLKKWTGFLMVGVLAAILGYLAGTEFRLKYRGQQIYDFLSSQENNQSHLLRSK